MPRSRNFHMHHYGMHGTVKWYPLLLHDRLSVDHLNDLLEKGWYIPRVEGPQLHFPLFYISHEVHRGLHRDLEGTESRTADADANSHLLVMLCKGKGEQIQVAVEMPVDSRGYKDFAALLRFLEEEKQWESHLTFSVTPSLMIAILERRKIAPGGKS